MGFGAEFYCPGFRRSAGISVGIFGSDFGGDLDFSGVKKNGDSVARPGGDFFQKTGIYHGVDWRGIFTSFLPLLRRTSHIA